MSNVEDLEQLTIELDKLERHDNSGLSNRIFEIIGNIQNLNKKLAYATLINMSLELCGGSFYHKQEHTLDESLKIVPDSSVDTYKNLMIKIIEKSKDNKCDTSEVFKPLAESLKIVPDSHLSAYKDLINEFIIMDAYVATEMTETPLAYLFRDKPHSVDTYRDLTIEFVKKKGEVIHTVMSKRLAAKLAESLKIVPDSHLGAYKDLLNEFIGMKNTYVSIHMAELPLAYLFRDKPHSVDTYRDLTIEFVKKKGKNNEHVGSEVKPLAESLKIVPDLHLSSYKDLINEFIGMNIYVATEMTETPLAYLFRDKPHSVDTYRDLMIEFINKKGEEINSRGYGSLWTKTLAESLNIVPDSSVDAFKNSMIKFMDEDIDIAFNLMSPLAKYFEKYTSDSVGRFCDVTLNIDSDKLKFFDGKTKASQYASQILSPV